MSKLAPPNLILIVLLMLPPLAVNSAPRASAALPPSTVSSIGLADIIGDYPGILKFKCACTNNPGDPFARGRGLFSVSLNGKFTISLFNIHKFAGHLRILPRERNDVIVAELTFEKNTPQGYPLPQEFPPIIVMITITKDADQNAAIKITHKTGIFSFLPNPANPRRLQ